MLSCSIVSNSFVTPWTVAHQAPLSMGILQATILEWVAMPFSRGSSQPIDRTQVSCTAGGFLPEKPKNTGVGSLSLLQGIFPTQESSWDLLHGRWILYPLSYQGSAYKYNEILGKFMEAATGSTENATINFANSEKSVYYIRVRQLPHYACGGISRAGNV